MDAANPILRRIYSMKGGADECREIYETWAKTYERDTLEDMGYVGPAIAAETLAPLLPGNAVVLDAGCGTGLAGSELARRTDAVIDGVDISREMLSKAAQKSVYRTLGEADLTKPLAIDAGTYDAVICVGVFTNGHVGPKALDEMARVAKPGAPLVFTVHQDVWASGYAEQLERLAANGRVRVRRIIDAPYHEKEGYRCRLCVVEAA
jgi:predicted TPR repeat methyltransferase